MLYVICYALLNTEPYQHTNVTLAAVATAAGISIDTTALPYDHHRYLYHCYNYSTVATDIVISTTLTFTHCLSIATCLRDPCYANTIITTTCNTACGNFLLLWHLSALARMATNLIQLAKPIGQSRDMLADQSIFPTSPNTMLHIPLIHMAYDNRLCFHCFRWGGPTCSVNLFTVLRAFFSRRFTCCCFKWEMFFSVVMLIRRVGKVMLRGPAGDAKRLDYNS